MSAMLRTPGGTVIRKKGRISAEMPSTETIHSQTRAAGARSRDRNISSIGFAIPGPSCNLDQADPGQEEDRMTDGHRRATTLVCVALLGCASKPVTGPRAIVPESVPSELRAAATPGKPFGHMVALGVGVSNGSAKYYGTSAGPVLARDG